MAYYGEVGKNCTRVEQHMGTILCQWSTDVDNFCESSVGMSSLEVKRGITHVEERNGGEALGSC